MSQPPQSLVYHHSHSREEVLPASDANRTQAAHADAAPSAPASIKPSPLRRSRTPTVPSSLAGTMSRTILLLLVALSAAIVTVAKPPVNISFPEQPTREQANVVDDNFIGISFELSSFDTLCGF